MASSSSGGKADRLFVGNLSPTVDEYTLVQVFSKYGVIAKLDLMVHNSGPQKGKPRGYAFVEYESKDDAMKALVKLHDRLLRGRKLVVTYANAAPADEGMYQKSRRVGDSLKPTTLSLLKAQRKPQSADAQIAAMEAKLAAMQRRPDREPTPERLAADELEAEIRRELEADANRGSTTRAASRDRDAASISTAAPSPAAPSPAALSTNSPLPSATSSPKPPVLSEIAGLPPKPVVAPLSPRRWERGAGEDRSPRRRWDDTPRRRDDRSPRDRSPRRREDRPSPRRDRDRSPPPRRRDDRSPRDYSPCPSDTFQRSLALLPKKPAF